jgi:hypothetical protein
VAISAVGSLVSSTGANGTSLSVTPTTNGNAWLLFVKVGDSTLSVTSITGGGVPASGPGSWQRVAGPYADTSGTPHDHEIWLGKITTTGASTITITPSGPTTSINIDLDAQEFTAGLGTSTIWARDGSQQSGQTNASSTTVTFPSLTAVGGGELYFGHARVPAAPVAGSTTGFTYVTDANGNQIAYNGNAGSGTVAPTSSIAVAGVTSTIGVLITGTSGSALAVAADGLAASTGSFGAGLQMAVAATGLAASTGIANAQQTYSVAAQGLAGSTGTAGAGQAMAVGATGVGASTGLASIQQTYAVTAQGLAASMGTAGVVLQPAGGATGLEGSTGTASPTMVYGVSAQGLGASAGTADISLGMADSASGFAASTGSAAISKALNIGATGLAASTGGAAAFIYVSMSALAASTGSAVINTKVIASAQGLERSTGSASLINAILIGASGTVGSTGTFSLTQFHYLYGSGLVVTSNVMSSKSPVSAVQFATQQSLPDQLVPDDDLIDPSLASYNWADPTRWHKIGDANLAYGPDGTSVEMWRYVVPPSRPITRFGSSLVGTLVQPVPQPVFDSRTITVEDTAAAAQTYGGIASPSVYPSAAGRIYVAARVTVESDLTSPLMLQIISGTNGAVLAEKDITAHAGDQVEWYVGYTIGSFYAPPPPPRIYSARSLVNRPVHKDFSDNPVGYTVPSTASPSVADSIVQAQLIQRGKSNDVWRLDALSIFDDGVLWEFSVDAGGTWYPGLDIRNNANGILVFPQPGNKFMWRATGLRPNRTITGIQLRPRYVGTPGIKLEHAARGPNLSTYDQVLPIENDPMFSGWTIPVPRYWFKGTPINPLVGGIVIPSGAGGGTAAPTPPAPPPAPANPSGQAMPNSDLAGWKLIFNDDFTVDVPLGSFPEAVSTKWTAYPWGPPPDWHDTSGNGFYHPHRVLSVGGSVLNMDIHTENIGGINYHLVAAPVPILPGIAPYHGQRYGRYAVRFRSDILPLYKTAWLLWPDSDTWPGDGEIDFPEAALDGNNTISAFMHRQAGISGSDQDAYSTSIKEAASGWHTAIIEWSAGRCAFILDGVTIGVSTSRVPNSPMHWILQTETSLSGVAPDPSTRGNVQIDWVAIWAPT